MADVLRFSKDGETMAVYDTDERTFRFPNQWDMDHLPVGDDLTEDEIEYGLED